MEVYKNIGSIIDCTIVEENIVKVEAHATKTTRIKPQYNSIVVI